MIELAHPAALRIGRHIGGSQKWYKKWYRRFSGCGPCNAALLCWYLAQTDERFAGLCDTGSGGKADFQALMEEMFSFVTPGNRGVDTGEKFAEGLAAFGVRHGVELQTNLLRLPDGGAADFLVQYLTADRPVAFLNLHSGKVKDLDDWHWMTVYGYDPDSGTVCYCDQGEGKTFSLSQWQRETRRGGWFAAVF
ncbi:MAG: hypothetical protein LBR73_00235 [Oscillospiraceae bacterium]|jgi:hypothetical protein|nr:hypothetical protein [Oscillospiraceae bacterium]